MCPSPLQKDRVRGIPQEESPSLQHDEYIEP